MDSWGGRERKGEGKTVCETTTQQSFENRVHHQSCRTTAVRRNAKPLLVAYRRNILSESHKKNSTQKENLQYISEWKNFTMFEWPKKYTYFPQSHSHSVPLRMVLLLLLQNDDDSKRCQDRFAMSISAPSLRIYLISSLLINCHLNIL